MKLRFAHLLAACCMAYSAASSATVVTNNLALDWSTSANPNGPWSYLQGTSPLLAHPTTPALGLATPSFGPASGLLPFFFQTGGTGSDIGVHSVDPFNGNSSLGDAILVWTAPSAGHENVSGYFYYDQPNVSRGQNISIFLGSTLLGSATVAYNSFQDNAHRWNFAFNDVAFNAGDKLAIDFATPSTFGGSGTVVAGNVIVSAVPLPAAYALFMGGLGLMGWVSRRRKPA